MKRDGEFLSGILDSLDEGAYTVDSERRLLSWNRGAERTTGYTWREVVGRSCCEEVPCHVDAEGRPLSHTGCPLARTLADGLTRETNAFLRHRDGHRVPTRLRTAAVRSRAGRIIGAVELFHVPSESAPSRGTQSELERMAYGDWLTGLANRRFTELRLGQFLSEMERYRRSFGVVMFDVDAFKRVNDTLGHLVGDEVLRLVGKTLGSCSRPFDVVGRWGGDEFLALIKDIDGRRLERVRQKYGRQVEDLGLGVEGGVLRVTVSFGATLAEPGDSAEAVLARADGLMYAEKERRRDRCDSFPVLSPGPPGAVTTRGRSVIGFK